MRAITKIVVFAIVIFIVASASFAQEWTKEQKEVWQVVEDGWAKTKAGDITGGTALLHEKYQGWSNADPLPVSKEDLLEFYTEWKDVWKLDYYYVNPARIVVTDNAAVVDYYYETSWTVTWGEKKETSERTGKNVEFYVKEGGKWLLLGDMTARDKEKK